MDSQAPHDLFAGRLPAALFNWAPFGRAKRRLLRLDPARELEFSGSGARRKAPFFRSRQQRPARANLRAFTATERAMTSTGIISSPRVFLFLAAAILAAPAHAQTPAAGTDLAPAAYEAKALEILMRSVDFRTVAGDKAAQGAYAAWLAGELVKGGFSKSDVTVDLSGPAPTLVAVYQGAAEAPPLVLSGHMDVVEADPADWTRDPFKAVNENGFVYGRGAVDNKFDVAMMTATLIRLKAEKFTPQRDIVLALSGDEETSMVTTAALARLFRGAHLVLNGDGGGGTLREDGSPLAYSLQTAEKT
ncbi:MAG TPA: hypothetical protein DEA40_13640, partial [Parvularcula sp.]|nr:hypothetical protein [Parvularcula sp.]